MAHTRYFLTGDIIHAGRVVVTADSLEEAIAKAEAGGVDQRASHPPPSGVG